MNFLRLAILPALISLPSQAWAQETVGGRLQDLIGDLSGPALFLISIACLAGGLWLLIRGLVKLKDSSGNNEQTGSALLTIVAAVFLVALPEVAGVGMMTAVGGGGIMGQGDLNAARATLDAGYSQNSQSMSDKLKSMASVTAPTNCLEEGAEGVTCMARNIAVNAVPMGIIAVFVAVFIGGLWGFGSALFELTKVQGGQRIPEGWWGRLIFSILLMNGPVLLAIFSQTILGNGGTIQQSGLQSGSSLLSYTIDSGAQFKLYEELIGYLFIILALFGAIAFVRGIYVMKAAGEGRGAGGASYGHGIVFMVAGVLLANAKISTCTILTTVGAQSLQGFGFCS